MAQFFIILGIIQQAESLEIMLIMKKNSLFVAFLVLAAIIVTSSSIFADESDSLEIEALTADDSGKIKIYNRLAYLYALEKDERSYKYSNRALKMALDSDDILSQSVAYKNLGLYFENKGELDNALKYYEKALAGSLETSDKEAVSNLLNNIGVIYFEKIEIDSAEKYFSAALQARRRLGDERKIAGSLNNLGLVYWRAAKFDSAVTCFFGAMEIFEKLDDKETVAETANKIGTLLRQMGEFRESTEYCLKSARIYKNIGDEIGLAKSFSNLGNAYYDRKLYDSARIYYENALELIGEKRTFGHSIVYNNLGMIYKNSGEYDKALNYIKKSLRLQRELGLEDVFFPLTGLGEIYYRKGDFVTAKRYLDTGLATARRSGDKKKIKAAYFLLYEVDEATGDYKSALENFTAYARLKDTLENMSLMDRIHDIRVKYESERAEIENRDLKKKTMMQWIYFSAISGLTIIILIAVYSRYRIGKKANKELDKKNRLIKIKNERLQEAHKTLRLKESALIKSNATKDKFFSILAHDLKNPIHAITLSADLLINEYKFMNGEQLVSLIGSIHKSGAHLSALLTNLLQWSRSQSSRIEFYPGRIELRPFVDDILELYAANAEKKKITMINSISESRFVYADINMIKTVFRNLVSNAIKFTNRLGAVRILAEEIEGDRLEITVEDDGVGIALEDREKLFRIDTHFTTKGTLNESGTGLGLILCAEFIYKHGGKIRVESAPGQGSAFKFTLPVKSESMPESALKADKN